MFKVYVIFQAFLLLAYFSLIELFFCLGEAFPSTWLRFLWADTGKLTSVTAVVLRRSLVKNSSSWDKILWEKFPILKGAAGEKRTLCCFCRGMWALWDQLSSWVPRMWGYQRKHGERDPGDAELSELFPGELRMPSSGLKTEESDISKAAERPSTWYCSSDYWHLFLCPAS